LARDIVENIRDPDKSFNQANWIEDLEISPNLGRMTISDTIQKLQENYEDNSITIVIKSKPINNCDQCGAKMNVYPNNSEMRCDGCGNTITLPGTVFEDSQFYNQQGQCTKHKKYDPNRHCERWVNQIQARENSTIPSRVIDRVNKKAIQEYTRNGKLRPMNDMKCHQVRKWLKEEGLATYNDHAALIRKIITGLNGDSIIPPQLTVEESQELLMHFSRAMDIYERVSKREDILQLLGKNKIRNKFYYPYGLLKILCAKMRRDPRLPGLLECIHIQSTNTITKNDKIWKEVCKEHQDYDYEPTDRAVILELS
jgi:hypothetical protein